MLQWLGFSQDWRVSTVTRIGLAKHPGESIFFLYFSCRMTIINFDHVIDDVIGFVTRYRPSVPKTGENDPKMVKNEPKLAKS